jgi:hypothetical protein
MDERGVELSGSINAALMERGILQMLDVACPQLTCCIAQMCHAASYVEILMTSLSLLQSKQSPLLRRNLPVCPRAEVAC